MASAGTERRPVSIHRFSGYNATQMTTAAPPPPTQHEQPEPAKAFDPDSYRMTIGEHLEELRSRLIFSILGFIIAAIVCLALGMRVVEFFCAPVIDVLQRKNLNPQLFYGEIGGGFMVYMKVSLICAVALAGPWMLYQIWQFVAAGLYPHEKRLVHVNLPLSIGLFFGGVALCEFVVLPTGVDYLMSFNDWLGYEPEPRLSDWLSFALLMPLVFGVAFQTPLVMVFLERIGLFSMEGYRRHRRLAIFLLAVLAAVISVTPDYYSMLALTVPLWGLYEVGILLCRASPRTPSEPEEIFV